MTVERVRAGTALAFGPAAVDPHNIALWIAVSAGLVGLAVAAWFAVEWIRASTVGNARADARAANSRWAVGGVLVLALTAPVAVQVLPVLGLVAGVGAMRGGTLVVRPRRVRFLMLTLGGIVALLVAGNALSRMPYEHPSADVSAELAPGAGKAASLWALDAHLAHLASDHWAYATESDPAVGSAQLDRVWASRAVARDAHDPTHALALARTLRFYGEAPEDVEAEFLECLRRWPTYPLGAAEYAAFLAEQDRDAEARTQLEIARLAGEPAGATMNAIRYAEDLLRR